MIDIEYLKKEIVAKLEPLDVFLIILFGSYAYGKPDESSDIDLYIVTSDDFIPNSFKENMTIKLKVLRQLDDLKAQFPIDTIVHTKKMYEKFVEMNSLFCRKIFRDGIKLYEKTYDRVA